MQRLFRVVLIAVAFLGSLAALPSAARAALHVGDTAPDFHKTGLDGQPYSLYQYRGKVVVLFLLGWNCPVCNRDGVAFQDSIVEHYQGNADVVVLGPDVWNGTPPQLAQFRINTGATYPLLLKAGEGAGNENLNVPYAEQDNYVIVDQQGIIRYHALDLWPHGNRLHPGELRGIVDGLLMQATGVGDPSARGFALAAAPNPFSRTTAIELSHPAVGGTHGRVAVHDVAGRRVATLFDGPLPAGRVRVDWDGRLASGALAPAGVYTVTAEVGGVRVARRIARVR